MTRKHFKKYSVSVVLNLTATLKMLTLLKKRPKRKKIKRAQRKREKELLKRAKAIRQQV